MSILFINTAIQDKIILALSSRKGNLISRKVIKTRYQQSEKLLVNIDKLLKDNKTKPNSLEGIIVVSGPGAFTALRVGVITANTLGFGLKIPVVGVKISKLSEFPPEADQPLAESKLIKSGFKKLKKAKVGEIVMPFYGKAPNITYPK